MKWEDREESSNVEDRRGLQPRHFAMGGGGLLILLLAVIFKIDPAKLSMFLGGGQSGTSPNAAVQNGPKDPEEEKLASFTKVIFHDTETIWGEQFQRMGREYPKPVLVLFSGEVQSACGMADAAVGPFYCPGDAKVYIDLAFYRDMQRKLNAPGEFARAYVVAHEVGHHVQKLLGYADKVDAVRSRGDDLESHHASVRLELQADYLAGVWAYYGQKKYNFLEQGDLESALNAAFEIGDDRLQTKARGRVVPDSFTHGTSAQRMKWFKAGFETGDIAGAAKLFDLPYERL
jgi:predicted metalloprotease